MKKFLKIIFSIIGVIILLAVILVIYVGVSISDKTDDTNNEIIENNYKIDYLISKYTYESIYNIKSNNKFEYLLTEEELNYILYAISKEINIPFVSINSIYSKYNSDSSISIYAPSKAYGFSTCIKASCSIEENDGDFNIKITDISLGSLGTNNFIIKALILNNLDFNSYSKALEEKDIYLTMSNEKNSINIDITKNDIFKMMEGLSKDSDYYLYEALYSELVGNDNLVKLDFNDDYNLGAVIYLNKLVYNGTFDNNLRPDLIKLKSKAMVLFNNGKCSYKNIGYCYDYLVRGYDALSDKEKKIIDEIDFSIIGINNKKAYDGIVDRDTLSMAEIIASFVISDPFKIASALLNDYYDITIKEDDINAILNSLEFIGTSTAVTNGVDLAYLTINSLEVEILNDKLELYLSIDLNGTYLYAKLIATKDKQTGFNLTLKIDDLLLGTEKVNEEATVYLLKYLESNIKVDFIVIDSNAKTLSLKFDSYISNETFFSSIISAKLNKTDILLQSDKEGQIVIRFYKSL